MLPLEFASNAAHILAEINAIHPFRRQRPDSADVLVAVDPHNAGLPFGDEELVRERVLDAMIQSFDGTEQPLADLIIDIISPIQ
ncbi:hypothetical protein DEV91_1282 [Phyllobacterium brassicacearum]|nr:hypothetical protein DEV91_1282 [Phyllobacterium brassicacearum]